MTDTRPLPPFTGVDDGVVALRLWRPGDADDLSRAVDEDVARWIPPLTRERMRSGAPYVEAARQLWADGTGATVAVVDVAGGALLGGVGLSLAERAAGVGEVGYWVAPWARGRGVATASVVLHAAWGLQVLGLDRVALHADVRNAASRRVAERAGFGFEGVARSSRPAADGVGRSDMAVYAVVS